MERSLYPSGVEVQQTDLARTESSKRNQILTRFLDTANPGVMSGCEVTPSATNGAVAVAAGTAYAPNGELITVVASAVVLMADATATTVNYVCAVYDETPGDTGAHETDGTTQVRSVTGAGRIEVFTLAQLNALAASNDTDLSISVTDRVTILAEVLANGAAAIPVGDITLPTAHDRLLSAGPLTSITGVRISAFSDGTPLSALSSNAELTVITVQAPGHASFAASATYQAPGDGAPGAVTVLSTGSNTIRSSTVTRTITIDVNVDMLPVNQTGGGLTEVFPVTARYEAAVPRASADDAEHRTDTGSSVPDGGNPHGAFLEEVVAAFGQVPQGLRLGSALTTALHSLVPRLVGSNVGPGRTLMFLLNSGTASLRVYGTSIGGLEITYNARWTEASDFERDVAGSQSFRLLIDNAGVRLYCTNATEPVPFVASAWLEIFQAAGAGAANLLALGSSYLATETNALLPRLRADYAQTGGIERTCLFRSQGDTTAGRTPMRVYRTATAAPGPLEITWNCYWDGSAWAKDSAADEAGKMYLHAGQLIFYYQTAALAVPWIDSAWATEPFNLDMGSGANGLVLAGPLAVARLADATAPTTKKAYEQSFAKVSGRATWAVGVTGIAADAFNISGAVVATTAVPNDTLRITFRTAMGSTTYNPQVTFIGAQDYYLKVIASPTGNIDIAGYDISTGATLNFGATSGEVSVTINGPQ